MDNDLKNHLDAILDATEASGHKIEAVDKNVTLLRQEFTQHAQSDVVSFAELKEATRASDNRLRTLELWHAKEEGAKAGRAPWVDNLLKILLPLLVAALVAGAGVWAARG